MAAHCRAIIAESFPSIDQQVSDYVNGMSFYTTPTPKVTLEAHCGLILLSQKIQIMKYRTFFGYKQELRVQQVQLQYAI